MITSSADVEFLNYKPLDPNLLDPLERGRSNAATREGYREAGSGTCRGSRILGMWRREMGEEQSTRNPSRPSQGVRLTYLSLIAFRTQDEHPINRTQLSV